MNDQKERKGLFKRFLGATKAETGSAAMQEAPPSESQTEATVQPESSSALKLPYPEVWRIWEPSEDPLVILPDQNNEAEDFRHFLSVIADAVTEANQPEDEGAGDEDASGNTQNQGKKEPSPKKKYPQVLINTSKDHMAAWLCVVVADPDANITLIQILKALKEQKITFGIQEETLMKLVKEKYFNRPVLAAKGLPAKDGVGGYITDYYKREITTQFEEDEHGNVDFKSRNNLQLIQEDDVICDIVPPIAAVKGTNVFSASVPFNKEGKKAKVPQGANTRVSSDGLQLLSNKTGHITFQRGVFHVDSILRIPGNVDGTTGNLNYEGDIYIEGDVRNGFSVKATGDIHIRGFVEGAELTAGGGIFVSSGISGNNRAVLTCQGDLSCKYLESCTVLANGNVIAESIVRCNVQCNGSVKVDRGIGAIIGGTVTAAQEICSKSVGSKARPQTTLILGSTPQLIKERDQLLQEQKQLFHNLEELEKNIRYLENAARPEKATLLKQLKEAFQILSPQKEIISDRLKEIDNISTKLKDCRIKCRLLFPVTIIKIGASTLNIQEEYSSCNIFRSESGDIIIGAI